MVWQGDHRWADPNSLFNSQMALPADLLPGLRKLVARGLWCLV
jgi:hypothetical protein